MSVASDKIIIIFSGYNNRAVISFIRTLEKNRIKYIIVASNNNDPIFNTIYKEKVEIVRENKDLELKNIKAYIELIKNKFAVNQCLIAPSTEALNRFLQKERIELEKMGVIIPLTNTALYISISDKQSFGEFCKKQGIRVPEEYQSITDTKYPFVAKPKKYFTKDRLIYTPFLIYNEKQKIKFLKDCDLTDFYFQEYVEGDSKYLLYYFHRNGEIFKFSQENIIQQAHGQSMVAVKTSDFYKADESIKYETLFKKLGFFGLVMIELKVNNNKSYMIEANPRFWGPSQLFIDAEMNFFEAFLNDFGFIDKAPCFSKPKQTKYFWFGGIFHSLRDVSKLSFHKGNESDMLLNLDSWLHHDIFKRADTIEIFKEEMK